MDNIIACIDGSSLNTAVCHAACWASRRLHKPVLLLHTLERRPTQHGGDLSGAIGLGAQTELLQQMADLDAERSQLALRYGKELLDQASNVVERSGCIKVETLLRHGDFVEALVELEANARLMVVGKAGQDHIGEFTALGSHIETLIRQVHTSLLIAPHRFEAPANFMLAYDGRDTADRSLDRVINGGLLQGLDCHLVMVRTGNAAAEEKLEIAGERLQNEGYRVTQALIDGPIFEALQDYQKAHHIGLTIMGAFAHSKIRRLFLGSNTTRMIESAAIPLIVLR